MKKALIIGFCILLVLACGTSRKADDNSKTQTSAYKHDINTIHPEFVVFHVSDTISELHYKINSEELLYTRPDGINFSSNVLISYKLLHSYDSKEVLDSASVRLVDINNDNSSKSLIGKMRVHASG